jgi:hypothetical protein
MQSNRTVVGKKEGRKGGETPLWEGLEESHPSQGGLLAHLEVGWNLKVFW